MFTWIISFITSLLIPCTMLFLGNILKNHPPKTINTAYGFRTKRSTKNQKNWDSAQSFLGTLWLRWSKNLLIGTCLLFLIVSRVNLQITTFVASFVIIFQLVVLIFSLLLTQKSLVENND